MNEELDKTEAELDKVKEELHKAKEELAKAKEELDKTREESHKTVIISISNEELDKIRKIKDTPSDDRKKGGCWIPAFFLWRNHYLDSKCFYKQPLCRGQSWCFGFFCCSNCVLYRIFEKHLANIDAHILIYIGIKR